MNPTNEEIPGKAWAPAAAAAGITAAVLAAYGGTLRAPFLYDDPVWITAGSVVRGAAGAASGRPLLSLTFALNRAWAGPDPLGYHLANLAIHVAAALVLMGVVRRTFSFMPAVFPRASDRLIAAFGAALLWALHPVNTEAVTYVSQRAESLMGLLYLLALYAFIRGERSRRPAGWLSLSAAACFLGMAVKETMVSAPVVILLYDRTFCAGGFVRALRARASYYGALAAGWVFLGVLAAGAGPRGVGYGLGYTAWSYGLVESWVVAHYVVLSVWPFPLVFDHGTSLVASVGELLPWACLTLACLGAALLGVLRRSAAGFAGAAFFLVLAPTSSLVPVAFQPMAEHRLYLPLAALAALAAACGWRLMGPRSIAVVLAAATALGVAAHHRNAIYCDPVALWADSARRVPDNERARLALGEALSAEGRDAEAAAQYREALRIAPGDADARLALVGALIRADSLDEAAGELRVVAPSVLVSADMHVLLGRALEREGRSAEAAAEFRRAAEINPGVGP